MINHQKAAKVLSISDASQSEEGAAERSHVLALCIGTVCTMLRGSCLETLEVVGREGAAIRLDHLQAALHAGLHLGLLPGELGVQQRQHQRGRKVPGCVCNASEMLDKASQPAKAAAQVNCSSAETLCKGYAVGAALSFKTRVRLEAVGSISALKRRESLSTSSCKQPDLPKGSRQQGHEAAAEVLQEGLQPCCTVHLRAVQWPQHDDGVLACSSRTRTAQARDKDLVYRIGAPTAPGL